MRRRPPAARALAALLALLAALAPAAAQAGYAVLESGTAPLRFYVGDAVELRLRVRLAAAAKGGELRAPARLPSAPWLDLRRVRVAPLGGGEWDVRIELVSFAPGPARVPRLDLGAIALEDLRIQTASILEEKKAERPAPPREQLFVPGTALRLALAAGLAVGGPILAAWLAVRAVRLGRRLGRRRRLALPWSRLQRALRRLRLRAGRLAGREFYIELTSALRTYLERRHALAATTATTRELGERLRVLAPSGEEREAADGLARLLARGDWVKFGGLAADPAERIAAVESAEACSRRLEEASRGDA
jgi:hypothetical protein